MNIFGQLGTGTYVGSNVPVDVGGLAGGVQAISAGGAHTCALTTAGRVKCWGRNGAGQLGTGEHSNSNVPVDVVGLTGDVEAISAGDEHTCALISGGGVKCWGSNAFGELGDGTNTQSNVPVDVVGFTSGVQAVSAGDEHTCALASEGSIKCWGRNDDGELGDGTNEDSNVPVDIAKLLADVNCDGVVDSVDAVLVLQLSAGLIDSLACQSAGDANLDGSIDAIDAALILQFAAGIIEDLPA
jgi:alpha-tubulin suppressor-like RCC1 family protein